MGDIELVIKIPEDIRVAICQMGLLRIPNEMTRVVDKAIQHGTPLPKGHGRLIDADVFEKRLMNARAYYLGETVDDFDLRFAAGLDSACERLVYAPTIIDAESEKEVCR